MYLLFSEDNLTSVKQAESVPIFSETTSTQESHRTKDFLNVIFSFENMLPEGYRALSATVATFRELDRTAHS